MKIDLLRPVKDIGMLFLILFGVTLFSVASLFVDFDQDLDCSWNFFDDYCVK